MRTFSRNFLRLKFIHMMSGRFEMYLTVLIDFSSKRALLKDQESGAFERLLLFFCCWSFPFFDENSVVPQFE
jgi:hypothetical protein